MKKLTLSLLCAGLITTVAVAEDLCNTAFQAGNYTQSEQCYIKQLKKERSFKNLLRVGASLVKQQRDKEALPYLKEAEKKAPSLDDYSMVYSYLGTVYDGLGDSKQTYAYYMKELDIALKLGKTDGIATSYNNLGAYYGRESQYEKAAEYFEKSLSYTEESKKGTSYNNLGVVYESMGDMKKAEEMYLKAIANAEQFGNYSDLGKGKSNLGVFYYSQTRYNEARTLFSEALVIAKKEGLRKTEETALIGLSLTENKK